MTNNLNTGVYYQDILADGSRSVLRQNFPTFKRVSYDKKPPVVQTLKITVEPLDGPIYAAPSPTPAQSEMVEIGGLHLTPVDTPFPAASLRILKNIQTGEMHEIALKAHAEICNNYEPPQKLDREEAEEAAEALFKKKN